MNFKKYLILTFLIYNVASLRINSYCRINRLQCKGSYDFGFNYFEKCEKFPCLGKYGYQCQRDICSVDKSSCDKFIDLTHLIKSIRSSNMYDLKMKQFNSFVSNFIECPFIKHELNETDVCVNGQNCFYVEKYSVKNIRTNLAKQAICPCSTTHNYHCGSEYCTVHSAACEALRLLNSDQLSEFKKCGNANKLLNRKIKLF